MQVQSLGGEDPLEEGMATHSSTLAMGRGAWWATVHGAAESRTQLSDRAHNITADSKLYVFPMYNLMMYSGRMMYHTEDNKHTTLSLPSHP